MLHLSPAMTFVVIMTLLLLLLLIVRQVRHIRRLNAALNGTRDQGSLNAIDDAFEREINGQTFWGSF